MLECCSFECCSAARSGPKLLRIILALFSTQDRFGIRRRHVRRYQTAALPRHRCQCRGNKPPGSPSESKASPHSQKLPKQADSESRHKEGISDNEEQARQEAAAAAFTAVLAKLQKAAVPSYRERHPFKWDLKQLGPTIPLYAHHSLVQHMHMLCALQATVS